MSRQATVVKLSEDDQRTLESWIRSGSTEQRLVLRARIILGAANGEATISIANRLGVCPMTVSKWRIRFSSIGITGLCDAARSGAPERYGADTEKRILDILDNHPPDGYNTWTGEMLANALGDVSADHVWRVLRTHGIHLMRRHSLVHKR